MFYLIEKAPWPLGALLVMAIFVLFVIIGLVIIRKLVPLSRLREHHDVAGFVFTNLGVLYAVLLGFTVVNVQQRYDKLNQIVESEVSYLAELHRDAEVFSDKDRKAVRNAIHQYGKRVIEEEWPMMASGNRGTSTVDSQKHMWRAYYEINPANSKETVWYSQSVDKLNLLMNARLSRLLGGEESLGAEMWTMLILGGIVMIGFVWFFGLENIKTHMLMAAILASSVAFLLFLIYSLDSAFSGDISIQPQAFYRELKLFEDMQDI